MTKKIFFNDEFGLTEAVLKGKKTMTRRICKYDRPNENYEIVFPVFEPSETGSVVWLDNGDYIHATEKIIEIESLLNTKK